MSRVPGSKKHTYCIVSQTPLVQGPPPVHVTVMATVDQPGKGIQSAPLNVRGGLTQTNVRADNPSAHNTSVNLAPHHEDARVEHQRKHHTGDCYGNVKLLCEMTPAKHASPLWREAALLPLGLR